MSNSFGSTVPKMIVAVDDRLDFCVDILETSTSPTAAERERAADFKKVVFEAITNAIEAGLPKSEIAIWTDTDIGEGILLRSRAMSLNVIATPGSGENSLRDLKVDFTGVRLTFNPEGDESTRSDLLSRMKAVADKAYLESMPLVIELDVVPTLSQREVYSGTKEARAVLMIAAMQQLQDAGIAPAVWAFEPTYDDMFTSALVAQTHVDGKVSQVAVITGAEIDTDDESPNLVNDRINVDFSAEGVDGLLLGPRTYYSTLIDLHKGVINRDEAVVEISEAFLDSYAKLSVMRERSEVL